MTSAAIYLRISRDSEQLGKGVQRQLADCQALAAVKSWDVAGIYSDNDIAASRKNGAVADRPDFQRMCRDITSGAVDAVIGWDQDRLFRDPLEAEQFVLLCERANLTHVATPADNIDISSGEGLLVWRIKVAVAAEETRKMSKRIKAKHRQLASEGRPNGGPRPYGYAHDAGTYQLVEDEAHVITEATTRILGGDGLNTVVRDLNRRAIPAAKGGKWTRESLRRILIGSTAAGLRTHAGIVTAASWPAIITPDAHAALKAKLALKPGTRHPRKRFLLGLAYCSCGQRMRSSHGQYGPNYLCEECCTTVNAERLEALVERFLTPLASSPLVLAAADEDDGSVADLLAAIALDESRLEELTDDYFTRSAISRDAYERNRATLTSRIEGLRTQLAGLVDLPPLEADSRFEEEWAASSPERRHHIAAWFIARVQIAPAQKRGQRFDPSRVVIELHRRVVQSPVPPLGPLSVEAIPAP